MEIKTTEDYKFCKNAVCDEDGVHCSLHNGKGCNHFYEGECNEYMKKPKKGKAASKEASLNLNASSGTVAEGTATAAGASTPTTIRVPKAYGWICPRCSKVNAPWKDSCNCTEGIAAPCVPYIPHSPSVPCGPWWQWPNPIPSIEPSCPETSPYYTPFTCGPNLCVDTKLTTSTSNPNLNIQAWSATEQERKNGK